VNPDVAKWIMYAVVVLALHGGLWLFLAWGERRARRRQERRFQEWLDEWRAEEEAQRERPDGADAG
jgi:hypothetical protein